MSHACTPILVGVASPVLEILLLSKTAKFPFQTVDYNPWVSKNLIIWNRLKNFMQVGIDVTCMHTNFGWRGVYAFGDIATFKYGQISLPWTIPWVSKNLTIWNQLKKFMQVGIDVTCMHTNFSWHDVSGFRDIATFKNCQISLSDRGL